MGLEAIYAKPRLSIPAPGHRIYPYLLRDVTIDHPDQCWASDITYIRMRGGFLYLVAIMDWYSRYVPELGSIGFIGDVVLRIRAGLGVATGSAGDLQHRSGAQFTSEAFTSRLQKHGVKISMDGRGRAMDNIFIERLWRTVKYDDIFLHDYANANEVIAGLKRFFRFYNHERPHQSLGSQTPAEVYFRRAGK
jgi:putative transposase